MLYPAELQAHGISKIASDEKFLLRVLRSAGGYYAGAYANGKEVWRWLKTTHVCGAEARVAEFLKEHRERRSAQMEASSAKLTFGAAAELYHQRLSDSCRDQAARARGLR
jgi:hypothetical protein